LIILQDVDVVIPADELADAHRVAGIREADQETPHDRQKGEERQADQHRSHETPKGDLRFPSSLLPKRLTAVAWGAVGFGAQGRRSSRVGRRICRISGAGMCPITPSHSKIWKEMA